MKRVLAFLLATLFGSASAALGEYRQMDLTVFGMD